MTQGEAPPQQPTAPSPAGRAGATGAAGDVAAAAHDAVAYLHRRFPLELWVVSRVIEARSVVVAASGPEAHRWAPGTWTPQRSHVVHGPQGAHARGSHGPTDARARLRTRRPAHAQDPTELVQHLAVPLRGERGEPCGELSGFGSPTLDPPTDECVDAVALVAQMLTTVIVLQSRLARSGADLAHANDLAATDALTGLLNRRGWQARLAAEDDLTAAHATGGCIVCIDLDGLKTLNDEHGHAAGDQLLRLAAEVLARTSRPGDAIARTGGDEFTVLAAGAGPEALGRLVARVRRRLAAAGVAASVGGASSDAKEPWARVWARADSTMYAEKRRRAASPGRAPGTIERRPAP